MNVAPLPSDFAAASNGQGLRADRVLNYIWIGKSYKKTDPTLLCDVPLHYLDMAFENARKHPDTAVKLWFDLGRLDAMSQFFVASHIHISAPPNVTVHHLRDIPAYAEDRLFKRRKMKWLERDIWEKVDVARLMVAAHCFDNSKVQQVFYSDFDVADVALDGRRTQLALAKHGMAFGFTEDGDVENSYFAFDRKAESKLRDLVQSTRDQIISHQAPNGYKPLYDMIQAWLGGDSVTALKATAVVPESGAVLPPGKFYRHLKISPWGHVC